MLQNYFRLAWRHLVKSKGYSFINIAGLGSGMAIALLIGLWIVDEFSFDQYAPNHSRIAKAMFRFTTSRAKSWTSGRFESSRPTMASGPSVSESI